MSWKGCSICWASSSHACEGRPQGRAGQGRQVVHAIQAMQGAQGRPSALTSSSIDTSKMPTKPDHFGALLQIPQGSANNQICSRMDTVAQH